MIRFFSERKAYFILEVLVVLALIFSGISAYKAMTLKQGEQTIIPGGTTVVKPSNNIADVSITSDGYLLLKYEDGTERQAGYILGRPGEDGEDAQPLGPTDSQVAAAVADYCTTDNRCDPKSPSVQQVALAVSEYCSTRGDCKGDTGDTGASGSNGANGQDGQNATAEQILAAVTQYCSDGRCTGPQGETGIAGTDGRDPVIRCVQRADGQYVAWKYSTQEDTEYKDLYQLPPLTQGSDCVDLTV